MRAASRGWTASRFDFRGGPIVSVTGDSGPCEGLLRLARGVDLLVTECSYPDEGAVDHHLCPSSCLQIAREARPKRILLVHLYPQIDERIAAVRQQIVDAPCPMILGEDGLLLEVV